MAAITWYLSAFNNPGLFDSLKETTSTTLTMPTGWTVAKTAAGRYSLMAASTERAAGTFGTTALPNAAPVGDDGFISAFTYSGTFASGTWDVSAALIAVSNGGTQDGRLRVRVWQTTDNVSASDAVEMTSGATQLSTVTNLGTGSSQNSSGLVSVTQNLTLTNAYIILQCAWEITGAGGNNSADVLFRRDDTNSRIITTDFTVAGGGGGTEGQIDPLGMAGFFGV